MPTRRTFLTALAAAAAWRGTLAGAQERFSPFVGSNPETVRRMIDLAALRAGDTVVDLGSGDGRIVFAALAARPDVRGIGIDINDELVRKSNDEARARGVADRVRFLHQNAFDADIGKVDVIFMWLFPELMRLLRPKILSQARAGTRVIAATWDLGWWPTDAVDDPGGPTPVVRRWIVPARIEGAWEWEATIRGRPHRFDAVIEQRMQHVEGVARVGHRREILGNVILRGEVLQFTLRMTLPGTGYTSLAFGGRVQGDAIEGKMVAQLPRPGDEDVMEDVELPWRARRTSPAAYYGHTGTKID